MLEPLCRSHYQKCCVTPFLPHLSSLHPLAFTTLACLLGLLALPFLAYDIKWAAIVCILLSGYCDTIDGSLARHYKKTSPIGAVCDIISDRLVEFFIIMGLFLYAPEERGILSMLMLGSCFICVTSFLVVGIMEKNEGEKGFHYSVGLMERAEAFIFFIAMIVFPGAFSVLALLFSSLVFFTAAQRIYQFALHSR
jgi:archaetidylinositol phosphate synthase